MGYTARPGRVAATKTFEPAKKRRALVGPSAPVKGLSAEDESDTLLTAAAGSWLKGLREKKGLSQSQLCQAAGIKRVDEISKVENGRARMRPQHFRDWATALGEPPRDFVKELMRFYAPLTYELLLVDEGKT